MPLNYLAYGSNLHPVRLMERVPSAKLVGVAELSSFELRFHKQGKDGSGKCNILEVAEESCSIYGAVYRIDAAEKPVLDKVESKGFGYMDTQMSVVCNGVPEPCFTYIAQYSHVVEHLKPYHWYKEMVIVGAEFHQFPEAYIDSVRAVVSVEDPDEERRGKNDALLQRMRDFC